MKKHKRSGKKVGKSNPKVETFRRLVSRVVSSSSLRNFIFLGTDPGSLDEGPEWHAHLSRGLTLSKGYVRLP